MRFKTKLPEKLLARDGCKCLGNLPQRFRGPFALGLTAVIGQHQGEHAREMGQQLFVILGEGGAVILLAQVNHSVCLSLVGKMHGQKTFHRWMMRRETDRPRITGHVFKTQRSHDTQQSTAFRQVTDTCGLFRRDAGVDELFEFSALVGQRDGAVARPQEQGQGLVPFCSNSLSMR